MRFSLHYSLCPPLLSESLQRCLCLSSPQLSNSRAIGPKSLIFFVNVINYSPITMSKPMPTNVDSCIPTVIVPHAKSLKDFHHTFSLTGQSLKSGSSRSLMQNVLHRSLFDLSFRQSYINHRHRFSMRATLTEP